MKTCIRVGLILAACIIGLALTTTVAGSQARVSEGAGPPPAPGFPVKMAIIVPLSEPLQSYGEPVRDGALLAIDQARAVGWDIQTVIADSECDAATAAEVANQVIFTDSVKYIVGAVCSSASIAISEIADANHVVQISPVSTNPLVTIYGDDTNKEYVFRACFLDPFQGEAMATVAMDLGATTAGVMYNSESDYVAGLAGSFKDHFEDMGGTVPVYEGYPASTVDFTDILSTVLAADPDVLFVSDFSGTVNEIAEQAGAMGVQSTFLGADTWDSPDLQLDLLEGAHFSTHFWPGDPRSVVGDFVQSYSTTYGSEPNVLAALAFDATGVVLQAIAEAGEDDPSLVKDEMASIAYEGVTDRMAFNEFGDPFKGAAIVKIEGGETVFVKFAAPVSYLAAANDGPTPFLGTTTLTATVATGSDVAYLWKLGDGSIAQNPVVTHAYHALGTFTAVVTASNRFNTITGTTSVEVIGYPLYLPAVMRQAGSTLD